MWEALSCEAADLNSLGQSVGECSEPRGSPRIEDRLLPHPSHELRASGGVGEQDILDRARWGLMLGFNCRAATNGKRIVNLRR